MDYALFILDAGGVVKTSRNGEDLGYNAGELEGQNFSKLYTKKARRDDPIEDHVEEMKSGDFTTEKVIVREDGSEFEGHIKVTPIEEDGEIDLFIVIVKDKESIENLDAFSSLVAHELRNSLSTAQGYLKMARETRNEEDFDEVEKAQEDMIKTITDLVLVTTNGDIKKEELNLREVFEDAYKYSDYKKTSYEVEDATIKAGRTSLMRLFGNLISNSAEHNEDQVRIEVGLLEDQKGFYYQDDGKGILEENRDEALKRGYSTSEKDESQGLGLYLMKQLADLNGWNVKLTESSEGGARFEIYTEDE